MQGVDIGAKLEIYEFIKADADQGTGIILIDSDFEDLARLCHRVLVLRDGHIVAELAGEELTALPHINNLSLAAGSKASLRRLLLKGMTYE